MLKNLLGDDAAEVACAGNQDALQPEAGFPAPLEHLAHELARTERQRDVDHQEHRPDDARDLIRADGLLLGRCVVRVDVQRADDAENHRDDGADEDEEEVVDARPAAPQTVDTLKVVRERDEHGDERHDRDVLLERRKSSCNRDEPAREAQQVCQAECRDAEHRVRDDVERQEQAAVSPKHGRGSRSSIASPAKTQRDRISRRGP